MQPGPQLPQAGRAAGRLRQDRHCPALRRPRGPLTRRNRTYASLRKACNPWFLPGRFPAGNVPAEQIQQFTLI